MERLKSLACLSLLLALTGCGGTDLFGLGSFVDMGPGSSFGPKTTTAKAGQTVTWTNKDTDTHSVTVDVGTEGPDSDTVNPSGLATGDVYSWVVPSVAAGTRFYYHCKFHGTPGDGTVFGTGMVGVIVVQ